eukprot:2528879-Amphidinium_carterae.1
MHPEILPHPSCLGSFVLANDPSLVERWVQNLQHQGITREVRHPTDPQVDEVHHMMALNVKVHHILGSLTCLDITKSPLPIGAENLLPKQLPPHPAGSHNPALPTCHGVVIASTSDQLRLETERVSTEGANT